MKFLITNDDGIDAAGLNALLEAAQNFGETTIVAPAAPQSGVSHAVTWHEGVRIEPRGDNRQSGSDRFAIPAHRPIASGSVCSIWCRTRTGS
jgi:5'/3'-nucleotidase SurE